MQFEKSIPFVALIEGELLVNRRHYPSSYSNNYLLHDLDDLRTYQGVVFPINSEVYTQVCILNDIRKVVRYMRIVEKAEYCLDELKNSRKRKLPAILKDGILYLKDKILEIRHYQEKALNSGQVESIVIGPDGRLWLSKISIKEGESLLERRVSNDLLPISETSRWVMTTSSFVSEMNALLHASKDKEEFLKALNSCGLDKNLAKLSISDVILFAKNRKNLLEKEEAFFAKEIDIAFGDDFPKDLKEEFLK